MNDMNDADDTGYRIFGYIHIVMTSASPERLAPGWLALELIRTGDE